MCMWNVILHNFGFDFYCQIRIYVNIFEYFWTNFLHVEVTDIIVTILNQ